MSEKNFLNIHVLISHNPSCLNRDDMNMQKSAIFGGKRRVRISSQSLKRAMRKSDYYAENLGETSIRSRSLEHLYAEFIKRFGDEFSEDVVKESVERFVINSSKESDDEDGGGNKKIAAAPWVIDEMRVICAAVKQVKEEELTDDELKKANDKFVKQKGKKKKDEPVFIEQIYASKIDGAIKDNVKAMSTCLNSAIDVALSGRMATSGLMTNIDGAMSLAHTITTHAVDAEIDWFTAVDDLDDSGSAHLDTQEFSSGVFYRYASLNLNHLQTNLGGASRERVLEIASHLVHMLSTVVPSAKQQSTAAYNLAELTMASFSDMPISLANAFEKPVEAKQGSGFLKPSIDGLLDYWQKVHKGYGLDERASVFMLADSSGVEGLGLAESLPALESWVRNDGKE